VGKEPLAFAAGSDLTYIGGIERHRRTPSLLVVAQIANALYAPLGELIVIKFHGGAAQVPN
jgi:transcriptional regulator with XRE-family HTH domain